MTKEHEAMRLAFVELRNIYYGEEPNPRRLFETLNAIKEVWAQPEHMEDSLTMVAQPELSRFGSPEMQALILANLMQPLPTEKEKISRSMTVEIVDSRALAQPEQELAEFVAVPRTNEDVKTFGFMGKEPGRDWEGIAADQAMTIALLQSEQESVAIVIEELEHDGQGFCAKVRWLYNPVPVGETLSWEHPK